MIALTSAENGSIVAVDSFSAAMHPGSPARRRDTWTTEKMNAAALASETTMPTIDRTFPEPARALDFTRPRTEKSRPSGQIKTPSTMPVTANALTRFTGAAAGSAGWWSPPAPYGGGS